MRFEEILALIIAAGLVFGALLSIVMSNIDKENQLPYNNKTINVCISNDVVPLIEKDGNYYIGLQVCKN